MSRTPTGRAYDEYLMGTVGGITFPSMQSKTRPSNTTAYSIGQVVSESTTAGTSWTFAGAGLTPGGTGVVEGIVLTDSALQSPTPQFNLWLFSAALNASMNDAAAFAPTAADLANLITVISLNLWVAANANGCLLATEINRPFACASGSTSLFGVLVAANAYTPVSQEKFGISLWLGQD